MDTKDLKDINEPQLTPAIDMAVKERDVEAFVSKRVQEMQGYRKSLKIEERWKEADSEYVPEELTLKTRKRFETDQDTGLRSRLVPIGDTSSNWRSNNSDPVLLNKIQSALSIIIDNNPEAILEAQNKMYEKRNAVAYATWKRNWNLTNAKEKYKLFVFNQARYGWSVGHVFPRQIKYKKQVLIESGAKKKYEDKEVTWFNDVDRQIDDPFKVWIDEMTRPYDRHSMNDWYREVDYSYDQLEAEFGDYANFKYVKKDARVSDEDKDEDKQERRDIVTVGFYENRLKDLYVIRIPQQKLVLHHCPLPNDDGMLSIFQAPWILRSAKSPYGISLWEMIKQKKGLYDKMMNMTMDQLVVAIFPMIFHEGPGAIGDGEEKLAPGKVKKAMGKVTVTSIPTPDTAVFEGLKMLKSGLDDDSGIAPVIEGEITGKTLGEILHAKEAGLKKMKIPLENIGDAMEQDAYLTISWSAQVLSTPEVREFVELKDLVAYQNETGQEAQGVVPSAVDPEGGLVGPYKAKFYPELNLGLEKDGDGWNESRENRFFKVGDDLQPEDLRWRGQFKIVAKSILSPSAELEKQRKMELFNILVPLFPQPPELMAKAARQVIKVNDEDEDDWLPDSWIQFLEQDSSIFVQTPAPVQMDPLTGQPIQQPPQGGQSVQASAGTTPNQGAPTVVPSSQVQTPNIPGITAKPSNPMMNA